MTLKLFNTLTRKKEEFKPIKKGHVGLYTCGPTVYDYAHIGNFRAFVWEDILRRWLEFKGFKVNHVMNITDVGHLTSDADTGEDKIEVGARREKKTAWEIADYYTKAFFEDADKLNILRPHIVPRATQNIKEMIELVQRLERNGYTYVIDDGVYYDTSKFKGYGKLTGMTFAQLNKSLKAGTRVELNPQKRNITDFALWKFSPKDKKRQMEWESPWDKGFPGWHIECSVMSMKHLGESFDIHTGGIEHIPIHHTNEIAQAEGATGKKFVNYWLHGAHLIVEGRKMSKSLGNFYTLRDLLEKGHDPRAIRYLLMSTNYRQQLNFTFKGLEAAKRTVESLFDFMRRLKQANGKSNPKVRELIARAKKSFEEKMDDNLNISAALADMFDFIKEVNKLMDKNEIGKNNAKAIADFMIDLDKVLGLQLGKEKEEKVPDKVKKLVAEREKTRKVGNYKKADELRKKIEELGFVVEDTDKGPVVKEKG